MGELKVGDKVLIKATCKTKENGLVEFLTDCGRMYLMSEEQAEIIVATKTYEDGLNEAWEIARKICKMDGTTMIDVFRTRFMDKVIELPPHEAASKIAEWESNREIHFCDEVIYGEDENRRGVVTKENIENSNDECCVLWSDGRVRLPLKSRLTKTGRTIDIAGLLAQIGGVE